mgnify:CR=1 FL=1
MPTYEYRCEACEHTLEEFQSITAAPLKRCPACGRSRLQRLIGTGAGVLFRGSGFYETDYRSESYKKAAEAERKPATTEAAAKPAETFAEKKAAASASTKQPAPTKAKKKAG